MEKIPDLGQLVDYVWSLKAERDQLRAERDSHQRLCIAEMEKNSQLRAELEAIRGQQPIYQIRPSDNVREWCDVHPDGYRIAKEMNDMQVRIVYALPPQQPDAVSVPRELLDKLLHAEAECLHGQFEEALESLRALSTKNAEEV